MVGMSAQDFLVPFTLILVLFFAQELLQGWSESNTLLFGGLLQGRLIPEYRLECLGKALISENRAVFYAFIGGRCANALMDKLPVERPGLLMNWLLDSGVLVTNEEVSDSVTKTYDQPGIYEVTLSIEDDDQGQSLDSVLVIVWKPFSLILQPLVKPLSRPRISARASIV